MQLESTNEEIDKIISNVFFINIICVNLQKDFCVLSSPRIFYEAQKYLNQTQIANRIQYLFVNVSGMLIIVSAFQSKKMNYCFVSLSV